MDKMITFMLYSIKRAVVKALNLDWQQKGFKFDALIMSLSIWNSWMCEFLYDSCEAMKAPHGTLILE